MAPKLARRLGGGLVSLAAVGAAAWHQDELKDLLQKYKPSPTASDGRAGAADEEFPGTKAAAAAAEAPAELSRAEAQEGADPGNGVAWKPSWAQALPVPSNVSREVKNVAVVPNMSGSWLIDQERSQHDELIDIMSAIGVPSYLLRMGRWSPSRMTVEQSDEGSLVKETITQLGGMYTTVVDLFMDGREVVGKQPLDGSLVITVTGWERFLVRELEPCNLGADPDASVVCCVSYGEYKRSGHRQRIVRFLDDDGLTFHSMNTLYKSDGTAVTAHRLLNRTS